MHHANTRRLHAARGEGRTSYLEDPNKRKRKSKKRNRENEKEKDRKKDRKKDRNTHTARERERDMCAPSGRSISCSNVSRFELLLSLILPYTRTLTVKRIPLLPPQSLHLPWPFTLIDPMQEAAQRAGLAPAPPLQQRIKPVMTSTPTFDRIPGLTD